MKRVIDLTEDTPSDEEKPFWKRSKFVQQDPWEAPFGFRTTNNALARLMHHPGEATIKDVHPFYLPYIAQDWDCYHPNFWNDMRYQSPKNRNFILDLALAKLVEMTTLVEPDIENHRSFDAGNPITVMLYFMHPEILYPLLEKLAERRFICSNFTFMYCKWSYKPTVSTPTKF